MIVYHPGFRVLQYNMHALKYRAVISGPSARTSCMSLMSVSVSIPGVLSCCATCASVVFAEIWSYDILCDCRCIYIILFPMDSFSRWLNQFDSICKHLRNGFPPQNSHLFESNCTIYDTIRNAAWLAMQPRQLHLLLQHQKPKQQRFQLNSCIQGAAGGSNRGSSSSSKPSKTQQIQKYTNHERISLTKFTFVQNQPLLLHQKRKRRPAVASHQQLQHATAACRSSDPSCGPSATPAAAMSVPKAAQMPSSPGDGQAAVMQQLKPQLLQVQLQLQYSHPKNPNNPSYPTSPHHYYPVIPTKRFHQPKQPPQPQAPARAETSAGRGAPNIISSCCAPYRCFSD